MHYWQIYRWIWSTTRGYRTSIVLCTVLSLLNVAFGWGFVWLSKIAVDIATGVREGNLFGMLALLGIMMLCELASRSATTWISQVRNVNLDNQLKQRLFRHLIDSEWRGVERFHSGDMVNRLESDVTSVVGFATDTLPGLLVLGFQLIGSFVMLLYLDATLAWVIICVTPCFLIVARFYAHRLHRVTKDVRHSEASIQSQIQESLTHRAVIKTLEQTVGTMSRLGSLMDTLTSQVRHRTSLTIATRLLFGLGFGLGFFFTFSWGVWQISRGIITYGDMVAFLQLTGRVQRPIADLAAQIPTFIRSFTSAERLQEMLQLPEEAIADQPTLAGPLGIRAEHVSFAYPTAENGQVQTILHDFSFDFQPGSSVAILGETGAGKTTLIRLLLALVRPDQGRILLYENHGTTNLLDAGSRRYFTYVPQGNTLLSGTIRSNLLLGNPNASDEQLREALRQAAADFVLDELPNGLETRTGESGGGLSEGQAQRIAIARALLRDAPILLLDESTSALDPDTEQRVLDNIARSRGGRLVILITHRLAAAERCDQTLRIGE